MNKASAASPYPRNLAALMDASWSGSSDRAVLEHSDAEGRWTALTGPEAVDRVHAVAKGLIALGVKPGERVGIMSRTRLEWTLLDFGIACAGAVSVPVYDTSSAEQVDWITSDADVRLLFVETAEHLALARDVARGESPLMDIRCIEQGALDELARAGGRVTDEELARRKQAPKPSDLATIIYTSGTTGRPKGVQLTHFNFCRHAVGIREELDALWEGDPRTLQFMTLAHVFARIIQMATMYAGVTIGYTPDVKDLARDMGTFKPTLLVAVPRVFEKVYNGAEQKAELKGKGKIFRWAARQATEYSMAQEQGGADAGLSLRYRLADALVLKKIRHALGGNAVWAVSGGAPLGDRLNHFFRGVGLTVLEGYGLTETTAASHVNRPGRPRVGTVGQPLQGVEVRIAPDGEILLRGDIVFSGYYRNAEATKQAIKSGWFHTGDLGAQDEDGYLTITGRKKEIIVTAGGKNVAPAVLEDRLRAHPLVSQCVAVGDGKPFIAALVTLDAEALPGWLKAHGVDGPLTVAEAREHPTVRAALDEAVEHANRAVSRAESIRKYTVLDTDFTVMNGYLTPSIKVKRSRVLADFAADIEALYAGAPPAA